MAIASYLVRRVGELHDGGRLILDLGCGDGRLVRSLDTLYPGQVYGYDLPSAQPKCVRNLANSPAERLLSSHIRFGPEDSGLPFDDDSFGTIVSNQVIEHVEALEVFFERAARVLEPDGVFLAVFPPKTHIVEAHCRVPFAHWLPSGAARRAYIGATHRLVNVPKRQSGEIVSEYWDDWIARYTYYRTPGEVKRLASKYFHRVDDDAAAYARSIVRYLPPSRLLEMVPHYLLNATLLMRCPRKNAAAN